MRNYAAPHVHILCITVAFLCCTVLHVSTADGAKPFVDAAIIRAAENLPARQIIPASALKEPLIPLQGSIRQYVRAVAHTNGVGEAITSRLLPCDYQSLHECVLIDGRACPGDQQQSERCEGMSLSVWIDVNTVPYTLHGARGSFGPVRSQADIEQQLCSAP